MLEQEFREKIKARGAQWENLFFSIRNSWLDTSKWCFEKLSQKKLSCPVNQKIHQTCCNQAFDLAILTQNTELISWVESIGGCENKYTVLSYIKLGNLEKSNELIKKIKSLQTAILCLTVSPTTEFMIHICKELRQTHKKQIVKTLRNVSEYDSDIQTFLLANRDIILTTILCSNPSFQTVFPLHNYSWIQPSTFEILLTSHTILVNVPTLIKKGRTNLLHLIPNMDWTNTRFFDTHPNDNAEEEIYLSYEPTKKCKLEGHPIGNEINSKTLNFLGAKYNDIYIEKNTLQTFKWLIEVAKVDVDCASVLVAYYKQNCIKHEFFSYMLNRAAHINKISTKIVNISFHDFVWDEKFPAFLKYCIGRLTRDSMRMLFKGGKLDVAVRVVEIARKNNVPIDIDLGVLKEVSCLQMTKLAVELFPELLNVSKQEKYFDIANFLQLSADIFWFFVDKGFKCNIHNIHRLLMLGSKDYNWLRDRRIQHELKFTHVENSRYHQRLREFKKKEEELLDNLNNILDLPETVLKLCVIPYIAMEDPLKK